MSRVNVGDYYVAKLQIRPKDEELLKLALKKCEPVKLVEYKFGYDIYLKEKDEGYNIAVALKKLFGGDIKTSKELFKHRKGTKPIYRYTFLFRMGTST